MNITILKISINRLQKYANKHLYSWRNISCPSMLHPYTLVFILLKIQRKTKKIALLALPNNEKDIEDSTFFYQECMAFESAHIFFSIFWCPNVTP